jgi:HPt (histidine-containing phosphotransfer) domain-containing protein
MVVQYNLSYLEEISAGDKDFIADMLRDFVINTPETILEVQSFIDSEQYQEIYKVVHRFIPSFDYVGSDNIKDKLRQIESHAKLNQNINEIRSIFEVIKIESSNLCSLIKQDFNILA